MPRVKQTECIVKALVDSINSYELSGARYLSHATTCALHPSSDPALTLSTWLTLGWSLRSSLLSCPCPSRGTAEVPAPDDCEKEGRQVGGVSWHQAGKGAMPLSQPTLSSSFSGRHCSYFHLYEESTHLVCRRCSKLLTKRTCMTLQMLP